MKFLDEKERIIIDELEENKYYMTQGGLAQAIMSLYNSANNYYLECNFQKNCTRKSFQKCYPLFVDYIFNEKHPEIDGYTIIRTNNPGVNIYLTELGLRQGSNFYQTNPNLDKEKTR